MAQVETVGTLPRALHLRVRQERRNQAPACTVQELGHGSRALTKYGRQQQQLGVRPDPGDTGTKRGEGGAAKPYQRDIWSVCRGKANDSSTIVLAIGGHQHGKVDNPGHG